MGFDASLFADAVNDEGVPLVDNGELEGMLDFLNPDLCETGLVDVDSLTSLSDDVVASSEAMPWYAWLIIGVIAFAGICGCIALCFNTGGGSTNNDDDNTVQEDTTSNVRRRRLEC